MKKLLIASAVVTASLATVAFADQAPATQVSGFGFDKPFVAATLGINTNDAFRTKATFNSFKSLEQTGSIDSIKETETALLGGIQAGANLYSVNRRVALGAELDADYSFSKPSVTVHSTNNTTWKGKVSRYSISPMVFATYSLMSKLTLKGAVGYGFQHVTETINGPEQVITGANRNTTYKYHKWEPVLTAEAAYNLNSNASVLLGDRYTFGANPSKNYSDSKVRVARENVVYTGIKYTF